MLHRVQIPSPNHSGGRPSSRLLVVHTSEGATTFRSLGNFLANPSSQVSYQVGFDDTSATEIGEYVAPNLTAWAAMQANSLGEHGCLCTPSGASAGWSRQDWLAHDNMLRACGAWLGEEADRYGVPLVKISADDIQSGRSGVCGHGDCSAAGAGGSHFDPGNFPFDVALAYALGGRPFPEEEDLTPEEHTFLVQIHESIPMLREDLAVDKDTNNNVAGTGPMNGYQNDLLNQILEGVNTLLTEAGKKPIKAAPPPG